KGKRKTRPQRPLRIYATWFEPPLHYQCGKNSYDPVFPGFRLAQLESVTSFAFCSVRVFNNNPYLPSLCAGELCCRNVTQHAIHSATFRRIRHDRPSLRVVALADFKLGALEPI